MMNSKFELVTVVMKVDDGYTFAEIDNVNDDEGLVDWGKVVKVFEKEENATYGELEDYEDEKGFWFLAMIDRDGVHKGYFVHGYEDTLDKIDELEDEANKGDKEYITVYPPSAGEDY